MKRKQKEKHAKPVKSSGFNMMTLSVVLSLVGLILSTGCVVFMVVYRTTYINLFQYYDLTMVGMGVLSLVLLILTFCCSKYFRFQHILKNLEFNLKSIANNSESDNPFKDLAPFPVGVVSSEITSGWNQLLNIIDHRSSLQGASDSENGIEQVFSSYESQRLSNLFDSLPIGIVLAEMSGTVVLANRSCEGMVGRPLSQIIGNSISDLFNHEEARENFQQLLNNFSVGCDNYFEIHLDSSVEKAPEINSDNNEESGKGSVESQPRPERSIIRVSWYRLTNNQKNSDIIITFRDITQQKISETAQNDFIAHVSHELRSPLANIRAYAETLLSDMVLDANTEKEAFNVINDETIRLTRMVNEVLDLSRMEAGSVKLTKGEVVMDRLLRQCINDLKAMATSKNITLQTNYHPKMPNLFADRDKLAVVVNNILSNAIKYTPENGTVFFETNVDDEFFFIKITDTGYGIPSEDLDRIFDKFYRVEREELSDIPGTGLGLATSKEIITQHGGTIDVNSEINKGTEMLIRLPLTMTGPVLGPSST